MVVNSHVQYLDKYMYYLRAWRGLQHILLCKMPPGEMEREKKKNLDKLCGEGMMSRHPGEWEKTAETSTYQVRL